jgi:hypothetical protein
MSSFTDRDETSAAKKSASLILASLPRYHDFPPFELGNASFGQLKDAAGQSAQVRPSALRAN